METSKPNTFGTTSVVIDPNGQTCICYPFGRCFYEGTWYSCSNSC